MLDDHADGSATPETAAEAVDGTAKTVAPAKKTTRKRTTKKTAPATQAPPTDSAESGAAPEGESKPKKGAGKKTTKRPAATAASAPEGDAAGGDSGAPDALAAPAAKTTRKRTTRKKATESEQGAAETGDPGTEPAADRAPAAPLFQAPDTTTLPARKAAKKKTEKAPEKTAEKAAAEPAPAEEAAREDVRATAESAEGEGGESSTRRKRRRGGRRRRKSGSDSDASAPELEESDEDTTEAAGEAAGAEAGEGTTSGSSRRRRRRRRAGEDDGESVDDPANTVTKVRSGRTTSDEITAVTGSTRLEAKKQRRREGREAGRRRAPIVSEAEFLARRESVNRVMVIRQREDVTQIGVLEDNVLVEHYVARESQTSLIGNVYLGRVQNVLPSMEAAFIDIGKGRNAVLYAGEVNWSALGHKDGQPRKIESVLSSGQTVLVQVTKDPIGHKGARLTSQISLAGRFLVYVPDGTTSGISRKLPDTERNRLKTLLKEIVPEQAGVIVRTAAEGASEEELTRDVERLKARWEDIEKKAGNKGAGASLLYGEPDLTLKVVRDLFTEDFAKLVIEGDDAWDTVQGYVAHVAPDLEDRLERYEPKKDQDVFSAYRIDEQIKKGLERKVWLPSGGSLIIDRTEAMTVVDVNTGKFTGSGGNLEETVTKNNLEAAEEIVRQLRLRDIGGIIVVDFIDMVLESNRDLVLRRLVECLGRDRTRHQVAEVTSLGLVQMTRKRIGTGLLESFSHECPHCHGRGVIVEDAPVEAKKADDESRRTRRSRSRSRAPENGATETARTSAPSPKDVAAMARHHEEHAGAADETPEIDADEASAEIEAAEAAQSTEPAAAEVPAAEETATEEPATDEPATDEPAAEQPAATPADETTEAGAAATPEEPAAEVEPPEPAPPAEPEKPRVVTRTRRRSASRPAGPPTATTDGVGTALAGATDGGRPAEPADQPGDETPSLHVPVKRKGARKR
jgi:ribonuclease E